MEAKITSSQSPLELMPSISLMNKVLSRLFMLGLDQVGLVAGSIMKVISLKTLDGIDQVIIFNLSLYRLI